MAGFPFVLVVIGSTAVDALVASLALVPPWRRVSEGGSSRIGPGRLSLAILATSIAFGLKLPIFWALGVHPFGVIHLVYVDLVVLIPAIGLGLLTLALTNSRRLRPTKGVKVASALSLILIPIGIYATWIEPYALRVETATLALRAGREGSKPVRIGILTDLQTDGVGAHERRAVDLLMAQKPDLILLPGDVFQGTDETFQTTRSDLHDLLARLEAPGGVFLVLGDTDGPGDHLRAILPGTSIRLLVNEVARVTIQGRNLTIGGVELAYKSGRARSIVDQLETEPGVDDVRILLAHRPDVALGLRSDSRVDVVVAGHTHGGQVVVPGFGPPLTLSHVPRDVAAGGLHRIGANPIYVSRGAGAERGQAPRVRFLCPPEVSILGLDGPGLRESP